MADIISIEPSKPKPADCTPSVADLIWNPPVFELKTNSMTFYVGENVSRGSDDPIVVSPESGVGLEQAKCWEQAIRQALMPVTPTPSVGGAYSVIGGCGITRFLIGPFGGLVLSDWSVCEVGTFLLVGVGGGYIFVG